MSHLIKKMKSTRTHSTSPSARKPQDSFLSSFSSDAVLAVTINIIVITAVLISFIFVWIVKDFLIENRTTTIFSLIAQQEKRHLGAEPIFSTWNQESSKQKFKDLEEELLGSYRDIAAIELHTTDGVLVWTSLKTPVLGTTPDRGEIAEVLSSGRIYSAPDPATIQELDIKDLIKVYVPIRNGDRVTSGVAEVYLNLSDIVTLTKKVQIILWFLIFLSIIIIYCLLRIAFRHRDKQISLRNQELTEITKDLEKKVIARTKVIEDEKVRDEALLASLGEGIIATDEKGFITAMNNAGEKMLDWRASEVLGKKLTEAIPSVYENGDAIPPEERVCLIAATKGISTKTTDGVYLIKKNGGRIPVAVTANPVIIENKSVGAVVIFRDITQEKELDETRRNLLSLASHQLRTPLSGTKWLIETLQKGIHGPLTEQQEEYLNEIYKINDRMTALVSDMMGVLRVEGNVDQAHKERVSVASIFYTLLETLNAAIKSKQITLHLPDDLGDEIITDQLMLRTILECLVSNAINYSPQGGVVTIGIKKESSGIVFAVKDSGIGIPQKEHSQIFERFYRASNAKIFDINGTGLGLYITSMLAKKIGVLLSFESTEGKGSTFYAHVPYPDPK
ncbi:MAG: hypothetical protein A2481_02605 [Candidatus Yonathbacteria bacterium RIFOXYC2_FULL_47_9]|nr:MAG: hypothetical protein A2481_02605 [Candidatus Yonathbacteria bacterium RIFOXYC2_FULL_47_9]HAT68590.1 hypothetical protein [Candidatus Yonathbacteria bacterium]